jgi:hypothetical protein
LSDPWSQKYLQMHLRAKQTPGKITTDMNWGCTLRVGQMLICNTFMRHLIIDEKHFHFKDAEQFEEFQLYDKLNLATIKKDPK